jgi:hypothetical protein
MPKSKSRKKKTPKRVLALPDLEQTKTAVLDSLTSASGQRTYDHAIREFVAMVLLGTSPRFQPHRCAPVPSNNAGMRLPRSIFGSPRFAVWRTRLPTSVS